jgi:hypothetical protein
MTRAAGGRNPAANTAKRPPCHRIRQCNPQKTLKKAIFEGGEPASAEKGSFTCELLRIFDAFGPRARHWGSP